MRLLPLVLGVALLALAAGSAPAEAGMRVGAEVCFQAIALQCIDACVETPLSPPDFCPEVTLPI
ncbi:MAG TPA: hypothetical protein VGR28_02005 [Candidatus Thermoplasmatota archaeon]|jgi:hypothetical protein|nr:hypothetical protein [Candidatus Thermoplasmatota archaeon]